MREFKKEGPECKCCAPKPEGEKITKAYARGVSDERKRIIKLLEDEIQRLVDMAGNRVHGDTIWRPAGIEVCERIIALIKGEN